MSTKAISKWEYLYRLIKIYSEIDLDETEEEEE